MPKKEEPLISVIVPVYKTEKHLNRCVESIAGQTYKNLEIILIDDGSPDDSLMICDDWARKDPRIRTIHQENGGQSRARNTGLSMATGDYITFVDSDDWIALDTYAYCLQLFEKHSNADVIQFDLRQTKKDDIKAVQPNEEIQVYKGKNILQFYMTTTTTTTGSYSVCRCLFKAEAAQRYRFREGKINEDIDYKYKVLRDCHELVVSNQIKYFYWQEGNSTSSGKLKARDFQLYEAAEELYRLTKDETYGTIAFLGCVKKARTPFSLLCRIAIWGTDRSVNEKIVVKKLCKENRHNLPILLKAPVPLSRKLMSLSFAISYTITKAIISLGKKII